MKNKTKISDLNVAEKLSDEELSKRLGRYQRTETIGSFAAAIGAFASVVVLFATRQVIVTAVLMVSSIICGIFIGGGAKKKKRELAWQQLGDFFLAEFQKKFGAEMHSKEMAIDEQYIKMSRIVDRRWERSEIGGFHEGEYKSYSFSAANVELIHEFEEKAGPRDDDWMGRTVKMFGGIIVKCQTDFDPLAEIAVNERVEKHKSGDISDVRNFDARFNIRAENKADAARYITSDFREMIKTLETLTAGQLDGIIISGNTLTFAINTRYAFADVPNYVDYKDVDSIRKWYVSSLHGMERILDVVMGNTALFKK